MNTKQFEIMIYSGSIGHIFLPAGFCSMYLSLEMCPWWSVFCRMRQALLSSDTCRASLSMLYKAMLLYLIFIAFATLVPYLFSPPLSLLDMKTLRGITHGDILFKINASWMLKLSCLWVEIILIPVIMIVLWIIYERNSLFRWQSEAKYILICQCLQ